MKNLILILSFVILNSSFVIAEGLSGQALIDSLEAELPEAKSDTNHVNLLKDLSFTYYSINPNKGIKYGEEAVLLSKEIGWKVGLANSFVSLGVNNWAKSNYPKALEYYGKSLKIFEDLGDKLGISRNLGNIGLIYRNQSDFPKALEYFSRALKIFEKLENKAGIATTLGNIGIIYNAQSNYPKALEYYGKALKIDKELENKAGVARHLGNMGGIYFRQSNYSKALEFYEKSLKINKELGNKSVIANNLGNIGNIYKRQSEYSKALEYFEKSLTINEDLGIKSGIVINLANMGDIYERQSEYSKALEYYGKALNINKEISNKQGIAETLANIGLTYIELSQDSVSINPSELNDFVSINKFVNINNAINYSNDAIKILEEIGELDLRSKQYKNLAMAYKLKGDMTKAYEALEEHQLLKDSVFNQEKAKEIGKLEAERERIETENAEQEAERIKQEKESARNRLQYLGIGAVVVAFGVLLLLSGRMKLKEWMARALVFLSFIFLFEFVLVMIDPWTDEYSEGIPIIKFAINMCLALVIFPMHQYFEKRVSIKVVKPDTMNTEQILEEFRKRNAEKNS